MKWLGYDVGDAVDDPEPGRWFARLIESPRRKPHWKLSASPPRSRGGDLARDAIELYYDAAGRRRARRTDMAAWMAAYEAERAWMESDDCGPPPPR